MTPKYSDRVFAQDREEHEPCTRSTPGCSIDHEAEHKLDLDTRNWGCETW
jgi:hypothetical protein